MIDIDALLTLIFVFLPILFAGICLYYAFYFLKAARSLEDNPTSKIRSAAQGYVELSGASKSLLSQPIVGKLTQTPCAWYRYTIEEFTTIRTAQSPSPQSIWNLLERGISFDPFLLDDGTGECAILPQGAEIIPTRAISWRGHTRIPAPPSTSFFRWFFWDSWGRYRYTEYRLELDAFLFASGMFMTLKPNDLRVQESPSLKFYLNEKTPSRINILLKEGLSQNENFIVSAMTQAHLARQYKWKALVFFVVFLFFTSLSFNSTYPIIKKTLQEWRFKTKGGFPSNGMYQALTRMPRSRN